jgi:hypothetical protein
VLENGGWTISNRAQTNRAENSQEWCHNFVSHKQDTGSEKAVSCWCDDKVVLDGISVLNQRYYGIRIIQKDVLRLRVGSTQSINFAL